MSTPQLQVTLVPGSDLKLQVEYFVNGQRMVEALPEGGELFTIRKILLEQKLKAEDQAKASKAKRQAEHAALYRSVAAKHGHAFANKTVGSPTCEGLATLKAEQDRAKALYPHLAQIYRPNETLPLRRPEAKAKAETPSITVAEVADLDI